jgi:hypothetical protein
MDALLPWAIGAAETLVKVLLAVAVVGFVVLAWRLVRHPPMRAVDGTARDLALASALAIVVVLTLLTPSVEGEAPQVRLVPFIDLFEALDGRGSLRFAIAELVGNVVLFIPLGMALRWRFPSLEVLQVGALALAASVAVELTQGLTGAGRWSDSTDVVMNTIGGVIGAGLALPGMARVRER